MRLGEKGPNVLKLQTDLHNLGYFVITDGSFGAKTEGAVREFQKAQGLKVDGIVGPFTAAAISKALDALTSKGGQPPAVQPPIKVEPATPWEVLLNSWLGETEKTGSAPTGFDTMIFEHTNFGSLKGVMEPGCAATLCAALELSGFKSPHNAAANSFRDYGTATDLKPGAICGMRWDGHLADPADHVTTCLKVINNTQFAALGGNQSHLVKVSIYDIKDVAFCRWPVK